MNMIKTTLFFMLLTILLSGCVNKRGISSNYYNECKEYYDFQGYYHKDCPEDEIITYKEMGDFFKVEQPEPKKGNVW